MSLDYPILPICQTAESFRNILSAMGPYRDSISLKKSPLLGLYTGSEAQLDLATGEISSERDGTKKMMKNLNIIQISHLTFECS